MKDSGSEETKNESESTTEINDDNYAAKWTRAEPFAVADPTLGRVIENFDPSKIPMLNLQLDIQKSSTGFLQSAFLEPMSTIASSGDAKASSDSENNNSDELREKFQENIEYRYVRSQPDIRAKHYLRYVMNK